MEIQSAVNRKLNELYEKYELHQVPKESWKDLCLIEMKKYNLPNPQEEKAKSKLEGPM